MPWKVKGKAPTKRAAIRKANALSEKIKRRIVRDHFKYSMAGAVTVRKVKDNSKSGFHYEVWERE